MPSSTQSWRTIFEQALLARAAYADLVGVAFNNNALLINQLSAVMSVEAAEYVATNFGVIDHQPNMSSGYSGTLFQRRVVPPGDASGGFVFAIRGTEFFAEPVRDLFLTDILQIFATGNAVSQRLDMHQHWNGLFNIVPGLQAADINVTGHSLGGHLATWFAIDRPQSLGHAFTFNAAGLAHVRRNQVPVSRISNVVSDAYSDLIQSTGQLFGSIDRIFIETGIFGEWAPFPGHDIENLMFGIASRYLLSLIDPQISVDPKVDEARALQIMEATANDGDNTYEEFAKMLRTALGFALEQGVTENNGDATIFGLIQQFESAPGAPGHRDAGELTSLVELSQNQLVQLASAATGDQAAAVRFAMAHGLPFAVEGAGTAAAPNPALDPKYALANFSNEYLEARAAYLDILWKRNSVDLDFDPTLPTDLVYRSLDGAVETVIGNVAIPQPGAGRQIVFGRHDNGTTLETLTGGDFDDQLFGGGGNDVLNGGLQNDFLDGGGEDDILVGGPGSDTANGGVGRDTYRYYAGDQHLTIRGDDGLGSGAATDVISVNLSGTNYVLGVSALSRVAPGSNIYFDSHDNRFVLDGTTLSIALEDGGSISIEDFASGDFGIDLNSATDLVPGTPGGSGPYTVTPENPPPGSPSQVGHYASELLLPFDGWQSPGAWDPHDFAEIINATSVAGNPWYDIDGGMGDSYMYGDAGSNWLADDRKRLPDGSFINVDVSVGNDVLRGGGGSDVLFTHGGNDWSYGEDGNDILIDYPTNPWNITDLTWVNTEGNNNKDHQYGGAGDDVIAANGGSTYMEGGSDNDELYAGAHDDVLDGGTGNDILSGDTRFFSSPWTSGGTIGNPTVTLNLNGIWGGETSEFGIDHLYGREGSDTLIGGGGNDWLYGGSEDDVLLGDLNFIPAVLSQRFSNHATDPLSIQGADHLWGDAGNDEIHGGGGNDTIYGGADNDTIYAGTGDDFVDGGTGVDYIVGDGSTGVQGVDDLRGGDGDDTLFGMGGTDFLYGDAGVDTLVGGSGDDWLEGNDDNDVLFGEGDNDVLIGGAGSDQLQGGDGDDILDPGVAGTGNQLLFGQAGNDTFVLSVGAGHVQVTDVEGVNHLEFGAGISRDDIRVSRSGGLVYIDFTDNDYAFMTEATFATLSGITLDDSTTLTADELRHQFEPGTVSNGTLELGAGVAASEVSFHGRNSDLILAYGGSVTDWVDTSTLASRNVAFETGDGAAYGLAAGTKVLVLTNWYLSIPASYIREIHESGQPAANFVFTAYELTRTFTAGDESSFVLGTAGNDVLIGSAEGDILSGDQGNDELVGGEGTDLLTGGAGDDSYRFNLGDGEDMIFDDAGADDVMRFGPGIAAASLTVTETNGGLHVQVGPSVNDNSIIIANWSQGSALSIDRFVFDDGSLTRDQVDALNTGNHSPRFQQSIPQQKTFAGQPFAYVAPASTFSDSDVGDILTYSARLADGQSLPSWLAFDAQTRTFSGTPTGTDTGVVPLLLSVADAGGLIASTTFDLVVSSLIPLTGTDYGETLTATTADDYMLSGLGGDDTLSGNAGDDQLIGGMGNDQLAGGSGNDTYNFGHEQGYDEIYDTAGANRIVLDAGIAPNEVTLYRTSSVDTLNMSSFPTTDDGLVLVLNGSGEQLWVDNFFGSQTPRPINQIVFADGTLWDAASIDSHTINVAGTVNSMTGTAGNDQYIVDHRNDSISEPPSSGTDAVTSSVTFVLPANVENLTLTGLLNIGGTGNSLDNTIQGNSGANLLSGGGQTDGADTLIGGAGDDQYTIGAGDSLVENPNGGNDTVVVTAPANPGFWTDYSLAAYPNVENLTIGIDVGSGGLIGDALDNRLTGNNQGNQLTGGAGNDWLIGGAHSDQYLFSAAFGTDTIQDMPAGSVNDIYYDFVVFDSPIAPEALTLTHGANPDDLVIMFVPAGDSITVRNYYYNGSLQDRIEFVLFADGSYWQASDIAAQVAPIVGSAGADVLDALSGGSNLRGLGDNDTLNGGTGNDWLDGGPGSDTMIGGTGDDTFIVDTAGDTVTESAAQGSDRVRSSVGYTLGANVENLTLIGSAAASGTGNGLDNSIFGNGAANTLSGLGGNDTINGGAGADTMLGGLGDDQYTVDNLADFVNESAGEGVDTISTTLDNYVLPPNVEDLYLEGFGFFDSQLGTTGSGNSLDNLIYGNRLDNVLYGLAGNDILEGGRGHDTLRGGIGDDAYYISEEDEIDGYVVDIIDENSNEGRDVVWVSALPSFTYTAPENVEDLISYNWDLNLTGNALANQIDGDDGNNILDGGAGVDTIAGYFGDDTYIVDNAADAVVENAGEGTDTVKSSLTWTLGSNFERLTLLGSTDISGTGNSLANIITGNVGNNILSGGGGADSFLGGAGDDTYNVDSTTDTVTENVSEGTDLVSSSVSFTLAADVENLTLTGSSALSGTGNAGDNVLTGNSGNNTLTGSGGNDTLDPGILGTDSLVGGTGNDTYVVNRSTGITVTESSGAGTDIVLAAVTYTLGSNVENLTLTGSSAINGTGNTLANVMTGNGAVNTLAGGTGNDTYVVQNTGDIVTEAASAGTDLVQSSVTHTLATNVENLTLTGTGAINGTGNTLANVMTGNSAVNTLAGGTGNDTYVVQNSGDFATEAASAGTDLVQSSVTYTLSTNVENLTLTGTAAINGTGNTLVNIVTGNGGDNVLDGSTGADTLIGGEGNDTYIYDSTDTITENAGQGTDTVQSTVTVATLAANVENLTLTLAGNINGTGNTLDNVLTGNTGANTLTGGAGNDTINGGTGNDTMVGGTGDDIYFVNVATDVVTENANEGTDTVNSSATLTLGNNVEKLTLTGSSAINGTGQALNNVLTGNTGVNTLSGLAGNDTLEGKAGNDALTGGDGADVYRYSSGDGSDTINNVAADGAIDRLVFTNVTRIQLSFARVGDDLVITRSAAPTDTVRVTGWFTATGNRLDFVDTSDGKATTATEIDALIAGGGGSFPDGLILPPAEAMIERPRSLGSLDELFTAASKPGPRQVTGGFRRRGRLSAAWNRLTAVNPIRRSLRSELVEPERIILSLDSLMTAALKPGQMASLEGIQPRLWSSNSKEALTPASSAPASVPAVTAETRQVSSSLEDHMAVPLKVELPSPAAGIEPRLWTADSHGATTLANPATVPVAMAEPRQAVFSLEEVLAASTKAGQPSGPEGIEPRLWLPASPDVVLTEITPEPVSLPVAIAESRVTTSSLDALMDLAGGKSRPVFPVCPVDDRFLATDESGSGVATPVLTITDAETPIRCELQLDRLIQAMASFKKPDGFDSLQQLPVADGLTPGTLVSAQGRYASASSHVELAQ